MQLVAILSSPTVTTTVADPPGNITGQEAALLFLFLALALVVVLVVVLAIAESSRSSR